MTRIALYNPNQPRAADGKFASGGGGGGSASSSKGRRSSAGSQGKQSGKSAKVAKVAAVASTVAAIAGSNVVRDSLASAGSTGRIAAPVTNAIASELKRKNRQLVAKGVSSAKRAIRQRTLDRAGDVVNRAGRSIGERAITAAKNALLKRIAS